MMRWPLRLTRILLRAALAAAFCANAVTTASAGADDFTNIFEALREADLRVQRIGERLAIASAALCRVRQPALGLALHGPDQYLGDAQAAAIRHFRFETAIGISGVVSGGAGAAAGLLADDSIVRIADTPVESPKAERADTAETARLAAFDRFVAGLAPSEPLMMSVRRQGRDIRAILKPRPACRARFEQRAADDIEASADGVLVQISSRLVGELDDSGIAVLLAHELAHNALEHRRRLDAAGVQRGLLAGFGRNVGLFRQTEIEADILSVYLLARAGYDPAIAPRFWRDFGPKHAGGLRFRTHPGWRDRAATMEAELPKVAASMRTGAEPAIIASRERPLDGDWEALLIRAR